MLRQWLALRPDGRVRVFTGKVDIGQGISHALKLIVAEELRLPTSAIDMVTASTQHSPDEAVTSGSLSVQHSGAALRCAAAHLREACRQAMAMRHGVAAASIRCEEGRFVHAQDGAASAYTTLADAALWDSPIDPVHVQSPAAAQDVVPRAHTAGRDDVAAKVFAEFQYIHDLTMPGLCHGMVLRPTTLTAEPIEQALQALERQLQATPGVLAVRRDGLLLGVLAEAEHVLLKIAQHFEEGLAQGKYWRSRLEVPTPAQLPAWLKAQALDTTLVVDKVSVQPPAQTQSPAAPTPAHQRHAEYGRPYIQHASIGLCCAIAQWHGVSLGAGLDVWSHSQGIYNLRRDLALAFAVPAEQVQVHHAEGAGCYGHNGADDVAFDAAWLAKLLPGRPVRVQWTRQAELGHAPVGPAMTVQIEAALNAEGRLTQWTQTVWSQGHGTRPGRGQTPALLGAWQTAQAQPVCMAVNAPWAAGGGSERNAEPPYDIANVRVLNHRVLSMPVRVSAVRALGAPVNVFAAESCMDELAAQQGVDPLAFRLAHLQGAELARAAAVLQRAADMAAWCAPRPSAAPEGWGRGLAFARYKNTGGFCAVVAEIVVEDQVRLKKLWIAADLGHVVHPDGAINQLEGGALQAASWALCEAAQIGPQGITSHDWARYPILKFSDMPSVEVNLMPGAGHASLGAGECASGPTCAAIGNAIFNALGVRIRSMPFSAEHLAVAIEAM